MDSCAPPSDPPREHSAETYPGLLEAANRLRNLIPNEASKIAIVDGVDVSYSTIPSREQGREIAVHIYSAKGSHHHQTGHKVVLNWHGSGYVLERHGVNKYFCSWIADRLREHGVVVYDLDYRKSPEHPFPAALEDVEDAILHYASLETTTHLALSGFSVGGSLATAASVSTRARLLSSQKIQIDSLTTFWPWTDLRPSAKVSSPDLKPRSGSRLPDAALAVFLQSAFVDPRSVHDWRATTALLRANELPAHYLTQAGTADSLHDDTADFVLKLEKEGHGDARFISIAEQGHGFDVLPPDEVSVEAREAAFEAALANIQKGLAIVST